MQPQADLPGDKMLLQGITGDEGLSVTKKTVGLKKAS